MIQDPDPLLKLTDIFPANGHSSLEISSKSVQKSFEIFFQTQRHTDLCENPKKTVQKLFLSELRQIFTNCENFWRKDGKQAIR